jgi:hypothetical protein
VEDNIMGRMGAMGKRMDDLERSKLDLVVVFKNKKNFQFTTHDMHLHLLVSYRIFFVSGITDLMGQAGLEPPDNNNESIMSKGSNVASTTSKDNSAVL